ncbi:MAG TPA: YigZ family protein [Halanaerobiales bacterium]|nr:YigZ family protein [Halanaerobiales bacterium]
MKKVLTPHKKIQIINKVKDSKFYGSISNVSTRKEAEDFITKIKEKFSDATHNVNAYRIGLGNEAIEYSDDDGEPSGSSGPPVLEAIKGENLTNTVIVITRYFGGTKLGIGGLIRAYGNTARIAINKSGKKRLEMYYKIKIEGNYDLIGTIMGQAESYAKDILNTEYDENGINVSVLINPDFYNEFKDLLIEKTSNQVKIKNIGHQYLVKTND